jgi:hypothetical protein
MKKQIVDSEYTPFIRGTMLQSGLAELSLADIVQAYVTLKDVLEGLPKERLGELRSYLLKHAESFGEDNGKGGQRLSVEGSTVTRERRVSNRRSLDTDTALNLAADKGLQPTDVCDEVVTKSLVVNPSKLDFLVQTGKLDKAAVEALYSVSWALKVVGSGELTGVLTEAATGSPAQTTESLPPAPPPPKPKSKKSK